MAITIKNKLQCMIMTIILYLEWLEISKNVLNGTDFTLLISTSYVMDFNPGVFFCKKSSADNNDPAPTLVDPISLQYTKLGQLLTW